MFPWGNGECGHPDRLVPQHVETGVEGLVQAATRYRETFRLGETKGRPGADFGLQLKEIGLAAAWERPLIRLSARLSGLINDHFEVGGVRRLTRPYLLPAYGVGTALWPVSPLDGA